MATIPTTAKEAFSKEALDRIAAVIAEVEEKTSAEIRVAIRDEREPHEHSLSVEELARKEFNRLRMNETRDRNGILLFVVFEDREFYIFGDEGVHRRAEPHTWTEVAEAITNRFSLGDFEGGVTDALRLIRSRVHEAMPRGEGDIDELSNQVEIS